MNFQSNSNETTPFSVKEREKQVYLGCTWQQILIYLCLILSNLYKISNHCKSEQVIYFILNFIFIKIKGFPVH